MSLVPLPEFPPQNPEPQSQPMGFRLSALDSYAGQPGALRGVSFWPRVAARVIDTVVHFVVGASSGIFFGLVLVTVARLQHNREALLLARRPGGGITLFVFSLFGSIALHTICEGFHGSSLGKILLGLVVVQEDGTPCRPKSAFIRSAAYFVDGLFFGLIGYFNMQKTPQQQRHGDEWAHTIVCRRRDASPQNLRSIGYFIAVFLLALMADATLMITALLLKKLG